jgi:hypothetical protein
VSLAKETASTRNTLNGIDTTSSVANSLTKDSKSTSKSGFSDLNFAMTLLEMVLILSPYQHSCVASTREGNILAHQNLLWSLICFQPTTHPGILKSQQRLKNTKYVRECVTHEVRRELMVGGGEGIRGGEDFFTPLSQFGLVLT